MRKTDIYQWHTHDRFMSIHSSYDWQASANSYIHPLLKNNPLSKLQAKTTEKWHMCKAACLVLSHAIWCWPRAGATTLCRRWRNSGEAGSSWQWSPLAGAYQATGRVGRHDVSTAQRVRAVGKRKSAESCTSADCIVAVHEARKSLASGLVEVERLQKTLSQAQCLNSWSVQL